MIVGRGIPLENEHQGLGGKMNKTLPHRRISEFVQLMLREIKNGYPTSDIGDNSNFIRKIIKLPIFH